MDIEKQNSYLKYTNAISLVLIVILVFYCNNHSDPDEKLKHELDSIARLNDLSIQRTRLLEQKDSALELQFQGYIDSINSRVDQSKKNQSNYIDATNFIRNASDTAYQRYITNRSISDNH